MICTKDFLTLLWVWALPIVIIILQNDTGSALVFFSFFILFFREGLSPYIILFGFIAIVIFVLTLIIPTSSILLMLGISMFLVVFFKGWRKEALISSGIVIVIFGFFVLILNATTESINYNIPLLAGFAGGSIFLALKALIRKISFVWIYLLLFWGAVVFAYSTDYVTENVLSDYQRTRIMVMMGLEDDPLGAGYNVNQSKIAIGSGGFSGKGFLQGTQTKFNFVPKQSTDFIFCTVGEEWGFIGGTFLILLFLALLLRLVYLAENQDSLFSRLYGYGVIGIFFFHFAINIGMTIGLAPVIGIPLPFFSYGGSSLWGFSILLFIFLKIDTSKS